MTMFVIDFDELHFGELFEIFCERARDVVKRAIRLAAARQIYMCNTVCKGELAIAREAVADQCQPLIAFDVTGTFEEFIEHRA